MTGHKHSHDTGRRPLRLQPLPRPAKPKAAPTEAAAAEPAGAADSEAQAHEDAEGPPDAGPGAESGSEYSRGEWIHEWEQPEG